MKKLTKPVQAIIGHLEAEIERVHQRQTNRKHLVSDKYKGFDEGEANALALTLYAIKSGNLKEKLPF